MHTAWEFWLKKRLLQHLQITEIALLKEGFVIFGDVVKVLVGLVIATEKFRSLRLKPPSIFQR
jgi:hypothetical protein